MSELLFFIIGLFIGVLFGVFIMCLCVVSKKNMVEISEVNYESSEDKTN